MHMFDNRYRIGINLLPLKLNTAGKGFKTNQIRISYDFLDILGRGIWYIISGAKDHAQRPGPAILPSGDRLFFLMLECTFVSTSHSSQSIRSISSSIGVSWVPLKSGPSKRVHGQETWRVFKSQPLGRHQFHLNEDATLCQPLFQHICQLDTSFPLGYSAICCWMALGKPPVVLKSCARSALALFGWEKIMTHLGPKIEKDPIAHTIMVFPTSTILILETSQFGAHYL